MELASQSGIGKQARHAAQVVPPLVCRAIRIGGGGGRPSGEQRPVVRVPCSRRRARARYRPGYPTRTARSSRVEKSAEPERVQGIHHRQAHGDEVEHLGGQGDVAEHIAFYGDRADVGAGERAPESSDRRRTRRLKSFDRPHRAGPQAGAAGRGREPSP